MNKLFNSKYGVLIFSLFSGVGYFLLVMILISGVKYSHLLGLFFFPTIVCGTALCLFKMIKTWVECGEYIRASRLVALHYVLIVFSAIFAVIKWIF